MHEEADVIIPHQVVYLASLGCCSVKVISDDTHVFVPLVHYYAEKKLTSTLLMAHQLTLVLLLPNTEVLPYICFQLMHCLGVTLLHLIGIGKTKVVKVPEAGNRLNHLGNPSANLEDVLCESTAFVAACYGQKCEARETMTNVHYKVWVSKTGRKGACLLPKLKAIPPTLEAFKENIKRAHFQACIGKAALAEEPPNFDPLKFGWVKDDLAKSHCTVPLPQDLHQQNYSKRSSACAIGISLAHLSDVDLYLVSFLAPYFANVVGLTVAVIK